MVKEGLRNMLCSVCKREEAVLIRGKAGYCRGCEDTQKFKDSASFALVSSWKGKPQDVDAAKNKNAPGGSWDRKDR